MEESHRPCHRPVVTTQAFPKHELYGLAGQIRRAAVSIPSNIAEGQGRLTRGDFRPFLGHARGSLFELESQIVIAENLKYIEKASAHELLKRIDELGRILNGLLKSLNTAGVRNDHWKKVLLSTNHYPLI